MRKFEIEAGGGILGKDMAEMYAGRLRRCLDAAGIPAARPRQPTKDNENDWTLGYRVEVTEYPEIIGSDFRTPAGFVLHALLETGEHWVAKAQRWNVLFARALREAGLRHVPGWATRWVPDAATRGGR